MLQVFRLTYIYIYIYLGQQSLDSALQGDCGNSIRIKGAKLLLIILLILLLLFF